jgi:CMP-N,N'-diacetyllegionaminic acid synthase
VNIEATAIILARAGSKGVPGKNIAPVAGRPCIAWTIDAARAARGVARVIVSTDGPDIADIALEQACEVVERPPELAHDTARVDDAARHAAAQAGPRDDAHAVVILYANVPVRPDGLIDRALDLLVATGCDSVQSYAPVGKHHPWWTARLDSAGRVGPWEGDVLNHGVFRRQDLPPAFIPDGGVVALTWRALFGRVERSQPGPHGFFGADRRAVVNPHGAVVDVDSPIDLIVADAVLRQRAGEPSSRS